MPNNQATRETANKKTRQQRTLKRASATSKPVDNNRKILGVLFRPFCQILVLIGVATILLSIVTIWQYRSYRQRTNQINGQITTVNKVSGIGNDETGNSSQKCRVGYKFTFNGNEYTDVLGYHGNPTTAKCNLRPGQAITINYEANHPANNAYAIDDQLSDHGTLKQTISSASGIAVVGTVPIIIGCLGIRLARQNRRQKRGG